MDAGERFLIEAEEVDGRHAALEARVAELERMTKELERANRELERANVRLARQRLGASDSAAASALKRLATAEAELREIKGSIGWTLIWLSRVPRSLARRLWPRLRPRLRALAVRLLR